MRRRLQHPALGSATPLQVLQEAAMELVGGAQILSLQPRLIRGHVVHRGELEAEEGVAEDDNAFLRHSPRDRMNLAELRLQPTEPANLTVGNFTARIGSVRPALRRR